MQSSPRIEELRQKFHENPRRYFAPLANEYRKAGDPEQAIAICRAHLAQQPGHMSGHVVYGQALYDAGRMDEAGAVFQQALALDPENIIVLRHLGDIARQRGEVAEARSWYSRALDGDPHDAEIAAYLAELTEPLTAAREGESESLPEEASRDTEPAALASQNEAGTQAFAQTQQERADAEAEALTGAESEGLPAAPPEEAVIQPRPEPEPLPEPEPKPQPEPEPEPEPQPESVTQTARAPEAEPESVAASEPDSDFGAWPELDTGREPALDFADANESEVRDDSLVSPYAREMDFAAPSEMKWDLNESPYLELVESSASDDAWDSVRSETPEAPEGGGPGLVGEGDEVPVSAEDPAAEGTSTPGGDAETSGAPPEAEAEAPADLPSRRTPSRAATPVSESAPIVTRTLAELYLQQGYIEPALEIYRQLADQEPGDPRLQARIEELSSEGASALPTGEEVGTSAPSASLESAEDTGTPERVSAATPGVNAEGTMAADSSAEAEPPDELWDSADSWGDWPFTDVHERADIFGVSEDIAESEPESPQSSSPAPEYEPAEPEPQPRATPGPEPEREPDSQPEPESEPEAEWEREPEWAPEPRWEQEAQEAPPAAGLEAAAEPAPSYAKPPVTVREFFATLGAARPPSDGETGMPETTERVAPGSEPERSEEARAHEEYPIADDAFANLFAGVPVDSEDSRAAAVLSGAVAHGAPFSTPLTTPVAPPARDVPANRESGDAVKESEEDIRRFREWLDGLAES